MSEILATNKDLKKIIDNAVKRIGESHGLTRDNKGIEMNAMEVEKDRLKFRKGRISENNNEERGNIINKALKEAADEIAEKMILENTIDGMVKETLQGKTAIGNKLKSVGAGFVNKQGSSDTVTKFNKRQEMGEQQEIKEQDKKKLNILQKFDKFIQSTTMKNLNKKLDHPTISWDDWVEAMDAYKHAEGRVEDLEDLEAITPEDYTEYKDDAATGYRDDGAELNESTKNTIKRLVKKKLEEGWTKHGMPGYEKYLEVDKDNSKINKEYSKEFKKKFDDYADFEGNDKPEFPHSENSRSSEGYEKYENTTEDEEFVDDFAYPGLQDFDVHNQDMGRLSDYLEGNSETGNAQTDDKGEALGNVVPSKLGSKILKSKKRRKEKIDKEKASMTSLRRYTPDVQKVKQVKEDVKSDMKDMKKLWDYNKKTQ